MAASTIESAELSHFLEQSRDVLRRSTVHGPRGDVLLATPRDGLRPFVSTRDLTASIVALCELGCFERARACAEFLLQVQLASGAWESQYDPSGAATHADSAEDVTALALWSLLTYARLSGDRQFGDRLRESVDLAAQYTQERTLNPYLYLVETTESLHEGGTSEGTSSGTTVRTPLHSPCATACLAASAIAAWDY